MPKSDTWPGGVATGTSGNMDSSGSYDSVISMNSGCSGDSMEHLSAEERACLIYLEATIESLEEQEDSGLSNDEPDPGQRTDKTGQKGVDGAGEDQKSVVSRGVPSPLSLLPAEPGSRASAKEMKAEQRSLNQTSELRSAPAAAANTKDLETSMNLLPQPELPVTGSATQNESLGLSTDGESGTTHTRPGTSSEIDLGLIPPPSDFMDIPESLPLDVPSFEGTSSEGPVASFALEDQRQRSSVKRTSGSSPVDQDPPNKPPAEAPQSPPGIASGPPMSLPPSEEPRNPPAVAPKPKRLPANIILKSHKASEGTLMNSVHAGSDRLLLDPQRVHTEALRKLGLLKSNDTDSGPAPVISPKSRKLWAAPPSPKSPAAPLSPKSPAPHIPPSTTTFTRAHNPPPASAPSSSPAAVLRSAASTAPDLLPAPDAFSDPIRHPSPDAQLSTVKDASGATVNAQVKTPPLTPTSLVKQLISSKVPDVQPSTRKGSDLCLSSSLTTHEFKKSNQSFTQLRNNRPRPASLGSRKEFSSAQVEALHVTSKDLESLKSGRTAFQHSGESQKLPRSQGISVLICPRAENGENRREALKKLGLIRD